MSNQFYLVLHYFGIILFFVSFGGLIISSFSSNSLAKAAKQLKLLHGIGLLLILVPGFRLMVKEGYGLEVWIILKIIIWIFFGASIAFIKKEKLKNIIWNSVIILGFLAVYLAVFKPF
ncbi:MAG: hypothetical protein GXX85_02600 [Ignavibacteria bacterium]|nr:hypothetical protein [Ignavibacteria bacterium]